MRQAFLCQLAKVLTGLNKIGFVQSRYWMPLLLVFTPAPKPARGADMDQPSNQVEVYSRCGLAVFLVLKILVQKLSNLSIKLHLGEVDTMQCCMTSMKAIMINQWRDKVIRMLPIVSPDFQCSSDLFRN